MEQINNTSQISVIPDKEERKQIRGQYNRTALILMINILIFNVGAWAVLHIICAFYGGGFDRESYIRGVEIFSKNEFVSTMYSCLIPIVSEVLAIILGIKLLGIRFRPLVTRDGYSGGTVMKLITLGIGLQTGAAVLTTMIDYILDKFGLVGEAPDLSATTSFWANAFMYFYACLLGPVLEELLYRGVLLQSMRKYNERFAIFLSAAIFGLMHQNYQQFMLGFLVGIPLAIVTIKYNSLIPSIFAHIFVNTSGMLINCLLQYTAPEFYNSALNGDTEGLGSFPEGAGGIVMIFSVIFRFGFLIAAIVVGIVSLVKGKNMTVPTNAGKARSKVFFSCVLWWIVLAAYLFLCFVYPFIR